MTSSTDWTEEESGTSDSDVQLIFREKVFRKHCLILQEYDGKGVFVMHKTDEAALPVLGLTQIVHFIRRPVLLQYPNTIRDILRKYVEDVSIFEVSLDRMNLMTNFGARIDLSDPPIKLFEHDTTVTLYLQNKKYLCETQSVPTKILSRKIGRSRRVVSGKDSVKTRSASETLNVTLVELLIIIGCIILVILTPYIMYCLIILERQALTKPK